MVKVNEKEIIGKKGADETLTTEGLMGRKRLVSFRGRVSFVLLGLCLVMRCGEGLSDQATEELADAQTEEGQANSVEEPASVPLEKKIEKPIEAPKKVTPRPPKKPAAPIVPPEEPKKPETKEEKKFQTEVLAEKEMPVLVVFWSLQRDSDFYRRSILAYTEDLAGKMQERVKVHTIDVASAGGRSLANTYFAMGRPCLMIFKNGVPAEGKKWYWEPEGSGGGRGNADYSRRNNGDGIESEIIDLTNKHIRETKRENGTLRKESEPRK